MIPVFVAYFVLTLVLGLWQALRTKSQSDFVLGDKKLPGWMPAGLEKTFTARAVTFVVAKGLAVLVTLLTKKGEVPPAQACPVS